MKSFNDIMALFVFILSVVCLATTPYHFVEYSAFDYVLSWMGVLCFSVYFLREIIIKSGKRFLESVGKFRRSTAR